MPSKRSFIKELPSPVGPVTIYGGYLYVVDPETGPDPVQTPQAGDPIALGEIAIDVTNFLKANGPRPGLTEAKRFVKAISSSFKDANFRCAHTFMEEKGSTTCYMTVKYPPNLGKMNRQDFFDHMIDLVQDGIKHYQNPPKHGRQ